MMPAAVDLNTPLAIESSWFQDAVPVDRDNVDPDDLQGFEAIGDETITQLCGAPADANIELGFDGQTLIFEVIGSSYLVSTNTVSFHADQNGEPYLYVDFVHLREDAPPGLAAVMLWRMVRACATLKIPHIRLQAVGGRNRPSFPDGSRLLGYYAWPRYGFDGPVQSESDTALFQYFPHFPAGLADGSLKSLLDLFAQPGGRQFWLVGGKQRDLVFEVAPTSRSVQTLHSYLREKEFF
ncbi:hypothetical protein [Paraburkholderia adhaesiva]|uniref:hypothetical protein n=1 Tax=Paraburkholderia adhaesiva TaxID=2883244 RepID=UPI001F45EE1F|nr:hypothetical protein [Paraburkholderia adhaesiva]